MITYQWPKAAAPDIALPIVAASYISDQRLACHESADESSGICTFLGLRIVSQTPSAATSVMANGSRTNQMVLHNEVHCYRG